MLNLMIIIREYIDGLVQERRYHIANALQLYLSSRNPSLSKLQKSVVYGKHLLAISSFFKENSDPIDL